MKPTYMHLYTIIYEREGKELEPAHRVHGRGPLRERIQIEEHCVFESWQKALAYWEIEFLDEGVEVISIKRQVPVVSIPPTQSRGARQLAELEKPSTDKPENL